MTSTTVPTQHCPNCKSLLDAATDVTGAKATPQAGDVTICLSCATVLLFEEGLTVRETTQEDYAKLDYETASGVARGVALVKLFITDQRRRARPPTAAESL